MYNIFMESKAWKFWIEPIVISKESMLWPYQFQYHVPVRSYIRFSGSEKNRRKFIDSLVSVAFSNCDGSMVLSTLQMPLHNKRQRASVFDE